MTVVFVRMRRVALRRRGPLTQEQRIAASFGYDLAPDEAAYFVHESQVIVRLAELRSRDVPSAWQLECEERQERREERAERRRFGGRARHQTRLRQAAAWRESWRLLPAPPF